MNPSNNPQSGEPNHEEKLSNNQPLHDSSRRAFVRKSLAAGIVAAQPSILAGLIRADGGGGEGTTNPWGSTYQTTYTSTYVTTTPATVKLRRTTHTVRIYLEDRNPTKWTTDISKAAVMTQGATLPPAPAIGLLPPPPQLGAAEMAENVALRQTVVTSLPLTEIIDEASGVAAFSMNNPKGGLAKGYDGFVTYRYNYLPDFP